MGEAALQVDREPSALSLAVARALDMASGDAARATKALIETVRTNRQLRAQLLDPLLEYACGQAVQAAVRNNRGRVWSPPAAVDQAGRIAVLARDNLLLFPLPGGKMLGDATRADIAVAQDFYAKQATDMAHKARWLGLVAQSVKGSSCVRDVLSAERLRELQKEAQDA